MGVLLAALAAVVGWAALNQKSIAVHAEERLRGVMRAVEDQPHDPGPRGAIAGDAAPVTAVQPAAVSEPVVRQAPAHEPAGSNANANTPVAIRRLAINYSAAPWRIRDCDDPRCAAREYANFDHVVLGAGLEHPAHPSHRPTRELIREIRGASKDTEVWGYVSIGSKAPSGDGVLPGDVVGLAARWKALGATGVFIDEYDICNPAAGNCLGTGGWPVTRARQVAIVEGIHALGLPVFVNSSEVDAALGVIDGAPSPLGPGAGGRAADMYLLENPTVAGGVAWTGDDLAWTEAKFRRASQLASAAGVRLAVVDTLDGWVPDQGDQRFEMSYRRASGAGVDAYAFTNAVYSASPALQGNLPIQPLPH